jgi:Dolichyl-phosphate-mannose-protein mannosyltransferase
MTREQRRSWLWASAALLAGLVLRLWFVVRMANVGGDGLIYGAIAKNWLLHGVYGFGQQTTAAGLRVARPTLIRLPGYPLFLAVCFRFFGIEHYRAVLYVQAVADLFTCWLSAALARRLFGIRAFLPILWLAALCPFTANYVAAPLTETLVLTTIALAFYGFARWQQAGAGYSRWLWVTAAALSDSILLRPEQGLLAAAVVPAMLWASLAAPGRRARPVHSAAPVLVAALCVLLPLVPWTARNWHTFHVFQPLAPRSADDPGELPTTGFNRWYRTWGIEFASTDQVYWNYDGDRIQVRNLPARAFAPGCAVHAGSTPLYGPTAALIDDYNRTTTSTAQLEARFDQLARGRIHASPICYYIGLPIARVINMLLRPRTEMLPIPDEWWKPNGRPGRVAFAAAYATLNLAYFFIGFAGLRAGRRRNGAGSRELVFAMAASVVLRTALLLTLDNSEPRYTLEFFPVLLVWAGALFAQRSSPHSDGDRGDPLRG